MKRHLNLIPLTLRKRQLLVWQLRRWIVACGAAAVLGGTLLNSQQTELADVRRSVQQLDEKCATLRSVAEQSAASRTETRLLSDQARWLRSLEQSEVPLLTLAAINQSTAGLRGQVQLDRLQFDGQFAPPQADPGKRQPTAADTPPIPEPIPVHDRIELTGSAVSDAAISSLLGRIEATGLFDEVELVGLQASGQDGRSFQLRCVLRRELEELADVAADQSAGDRLTGSGQSTAALTGLSAGQWKEQ